MAFSIPQDLFPWERGLGTRKAPPQFAGVSGECAATFWPLKRSWKRQPRAPDQQKELCGRKQPQGTRSSMGCGPASSLPSTLAHTLPHPALFLGSSASRLIVKFPGCLDVTILIHR